MDPARGGAGGSSLVVLAPPISSVAGAGSSGVDAPAPAKVPPAPEAEEEHLCSIVYFLAFPSLLHFTICDPL